MTVKGAQLRIAYKNPCRVSTTANHGLTGLTAIDSVTPLSGDRVLVQSQTAGAENGVYVAASGVWSRARDMDSSAIGQDHITAGLSTYVQEGTVNGQKTFTLTTTGTIVLGTTSLVFAELGGGGGAGDVVGPAVATDNAISRFNSTTGKLIQNSGVLLSDTNLLSGALGYQGVEQAAAPTTGAGTGSYWVRNDVPSTPIFTDDTAVDYNLLSWGPTKRPCVVATTGDVSGLAGTAPNSVDGISLTVGDRILVWQQTTASQNGIYTVTVVGTGVTGSWSRAPDFDNAVADHIEAGVSVYVAQGDSYSRTTFTMVVTGSITIDTTPLEFIPMGGLARTDASSTEIIASKAFTNGTAIVNDTGFTDMRDHTDLAVYFIPTLLGTNTAVSIVVYWSDDGTTVPFAIDDYTQQTDFNITGFTDGTFNPKTYTAKLTTAGGELVANQGVHLVFPKGGGACKVGVIGNAVDGAFSVRVQRLVR